MNEQTPPPEASATEARLCYRLPASYLNDAGTTSFYGIAYLYCGDANLRSNQQMASALHHMGYDTRFDQAEGYAHNAGFGSSNFPEAERRAR